MNLFSFALRNLVRRPGRNIMVAASVGLATASALSLLALAESIERGVGEGADEHGADLTVLPRNASDILSGFIAEDVRTKLAAIHGVEDVAGELATYAPVDRDQQKLVTGWADDSFFWRRMPIGRGRIPRQGERGAVVVGEGAAEALHKTVGDDIDIFDARFRIVGIAHYQAALNRAMIFMPLPDLQEIAFRPAQVSLFEIRLQPALTSGDVETVKADVARIDSLVAAPTDQLLQRDRNLKVMKAISRSVSLIAFVLGGLSVFNALLMTVQERAREIGVITAIGWSTTRTMASIVIEGVLIGAAGCVIAVPLAFGISRLFDYLPAVGDILSVRLNPALVAETSLAAIGLCAFGALYPAWRAASTPPAESFRRT
jgi:putative ABC transport system permease protein